MHCKGTPRKPSDAYGTDHKDQPVMMISRGRQAQSCRNITGTRTLSQLSPVCNLNTKTDVLQRAGSTPRLTSPLLKWRRPLRGKEQNSWLGADSGVLLDGHAQVQSSSSVSPRLMWDVSLPVYQRLCSSLPRATSSQEDQCPSRDLLPMLWSAALCWDNRLCS